MVSSGQSEGNALLSTLAPTLDKNAYKVAPLLLIDWHIKDIWLPIARVVGAIIGPKLLSRRLVDG